MEWYFFSMTALFMIAPRRMGHLVGLIAVGFMVAVENGRTEIARLKIPTRPTRKGDLP